MEESEFQTHMIILLPWMPWRRFGSFLRTPGLIQGQYFTPQLSQKIFTIFSEGKG